MSDIDKTRIWRCPLHFIAFGFGSGLSPVAPGTVGSVVGGLFYLFLYQLPLMYFAGLLLVLFIAGVYLCEQVSLALGVHDHSGIVWDEIVGILLTFMAVPPTLFNLLMGFLLFRIFDILKPFPISLIDKNVKGGLGIMLDDIVAAIPAWCLLQLIVWL